VPNDTLLASLRASLEEERDHLRQQLAELGHDAPGSLDFDENFADSGQVAAEQGESRVLAGQMADTLASVERALEKMDKGTFGVCERCGNEIAEPRLEAMPTTRYCISCASA
jgi:DnaK suppressor protein